MPTPSESNARRRQLRALDLLARSVELDADERDRFFDDECRGDWALRAEVASLAEEDDESLDLEAAFGSGTSDVDLAAVARRVAHEAFSDSGPGSHPRARGGARDPALPSRIGSYRILGPIGEGGMGVVLEAEQENPRRRVAVKVLSHLAASPRAQRRFEREADVMACLEHPAIARVFEAGRFETDLGAQPYLVMELVDGVPLTTFAQVHALTLRERVELLARVAEAVEHAHAHGVIHRDLKPANILVTTDGRPKVLDFGVARARDLGGERTEPMTRTGQMVGTLAYMSPEQVAGGSAADAQSDVYALGVLLYELLVGRPPHPIEDLPLVEAARVLRDEDPMRPGQVVAVLRGDLEAVILTALAKDRARRYPTAAALASDLRLWLAGEPVAARPEGVLARNARLVRRHAVISAALAAVFATLVVGLAAVGWQAARATRFAREQRRHAYVADIHAAAAALDTLDPASVRRHLESAPGDHHDWEWRYLAAQLDVSERVEKVDAPPHEMAVSRDGRTLVAVGHDTDFTYASAWAWDVATGRPLGPARHARYFRAVGFGPSGEPLALAADSSSIWIVDVTSGRETHRLSLAALSVLHGATDIGALAPGGSLVAASAQPTPQRGITDIITWDPVTDEVQIVLGFSHREWTGHGPTSLAFGSEGRHLAVGTMHGDVHVLDMTAPRSGAPPVHVIQQPVRVVAFSPDDASILVGGEDNSAEIVDVASRRVVRSLEGHRGPVMGAAWSHDGRLAMTASEDRVVRAWEASTGRLAGALLGHVNGAECVATSPDERLLFSGGVDGTVRTWSLPPATTSRALAGHESFVYPVAWSPDGSRLFSGSWDGTIRAWDARSGWGSTVMLRVPKPVLSLAVSPDGSTIAASVGEMPIVVLDARTSRRLADVPPHDGHVATLAFSPDGSVLACAAWDGVARLWSVDARAVIREVTGLESIYQQSVPLAFSPDGRLLATAGRRGELQVVDVATGRRALSLVGHSDAVNGVAFSPDGRLIATVSDDGTARTWNAWSGQLVSVLSGHRGKVYAVAFSRAGSRLATGSKDGTVRVWDSWTGDDLLVLSGHRDYVFTLAFSPDGERLASASGDGTVRLWEAAPRHAKGNG